MQQLRCPSPLPPRRRPAVGRLLLVAFELRCLGSHIVLACLLVKARLRDRQRPLFLLDRSQLVLHLVTVPVRLPLCFLSRAPLLPVPAHHRPEDRDVLCPEPRLAARVEGLVRERRRSREVTVRVLEFSGGLLRPRTGRDVGLAFEFQLLGASEGVLGLDSVLCRIRQKLREVPFLLGQVAGVGRGLGPHELELFLRAGRLLVGLASLDAQRRDVLSHLRCP
mmetsp:Transcript_51868/g.118288  ORF Transcript_51868/g.118288 Transcript_51868/m.118288 type:complete len:222 (-) Transcript_51868:454-1119(-)